MQRKDNRGRILNTNEYQAKDGRYRFDYVKDGKVNSVYSWRLVDSDAQPKGKRRKESLRTLEKKIHDAEVAGEDYRAVNKLTLNDLVDEYLDTKDIKQSTLTNYRYMYDSWVRNSYGRKLLKDIDYLNLKAFYKQLLNGNLAVNTLEVIQNVIHPALTNAVRARIISFNPADNIIRDIKKEVHYSKPKRHALTIAQQNALLDYVSASTMYSHWLPIITLLLGTGCRIGELAGLCWKDVDFDEGLICVGRSLTYRPDKDNKSRFHTSTVKTEAGIRKIPMFVEVKKTLQELYDHQKNNGFCTKEIDGTSGFILSGRFGNVINGRNINSALYRIRDSYNKEELRKAEEEKRKALLLPDKISCHVMRHTFCTRLCEQTDSIDVIMYTMGHSDIRTTMEIYNEVQAEKKRRTFNNIDGTFRLR